MYFYKIELLSHNLLSGLTEVWRVCLFISLFVIWLISCFFVCLFVYKTINFINNFIVLLISQSFIHLNFISSHFLFFQIYTCFTLICWLSHLLASSLLFVVKFLFLFSSVWVINMLKVSYELFYFWSLMIYQQKHLSF